MTRANVTHVTDDFDAILGDDCALDYPGLTIVDVVSIEIDGLGIVICTIVFVGRRDANIDIQSIANSHTNPNNFEGPVAIGVDGLGIVSPFDLTDDECLYSITYTVNV